MRTALLRRGRRLWNNPLVSAEVNRCNLLKWARSVSRLGDKWLLAQPVERRA